MPLLGVLLAPIWGLLGYAVFRRPMTLALCTLAFWAGWEAQSIAIKARCLDGGGRYDAQGYCVR